MKVILLKDIPKLGRRNEVREVSEGHARNFLIPRAFAAPATPQSLKNLQTNQKQAAAAEERDTLKYRQLAEKLDAMTLVFELKLGGKGKAFGSVNVAKIVTVLEEKGIAVEKDWLELEGPIKSTGEHTVSVSLPHDIKATVRVKIEAE